MNAEYGLVVQDDALVCNNFYERVEPLLKGDYIYQLYAGSRMRFKLSQALKAGRRMILDTTIFNELALCMKTRHIASMISYCDARHPVNDRVIQAFARRRRLFVCTPIPSLFDHRDGPSIYRMNRELPTANEVRRAAYFIDRPAWQEAAVPRV